MALNPEDTAQTKVGALDYLGGVELVSPDERFGGLSGLEVSADGRRMLAVTDRGQWIAARLVYDARGALVGVRDAEIEAIRGRDGRPLAGEWRDAEDIARLTDGRLAVSFERRHRVAVYPRDAPAPARAVHLDAPRELARAPYNGGIEALTALGPDRLLAVTEALYAGDGRLRGWLLSAGGGPAAALYYATEGDFHPSALATLAGGDVLALERRFTVVAGAGARLLRIDGAAIAPGATLEGRELARIAAPLTVDNFEGLALRRDARGRVLVYLVSDDNFSPLQRTLLMQFRLVE